MLKIKKPILDKDGNELSDEDVENCIKQLRTLIEEDQHLQIRTDDNFLTRYLYPTHFDVDAAYIRMKAYFKLKAENPTFWLSESLQKYREYIDLDNFKDMLEERDKAGRRVFISKIGSLPRNMTLEELIYIDDMYIESILDEPETQQTGISAIVDVANAPWHLLRWCTPHNMAIATKKSELTPITDLHFHVVNTSAFLNTIVTLVWPFLSAYTKEHIHFHSKNWNSLHAYVNPEILPEEYGGNFCIDHNKLRQLFIYDRENAIMNNLKGTYLLE